MSRDYTDIITDLVTEFCKNSNEYDWYTLHEKMPTVPGLILKDEHEIVIALPLGFKDGFSGLSVYFMPLSKKARDMELGLAALRTDMKLWKWAVWEDFPYKEHAQLLMLAHENPRIPYWTTV